MKKYITASFLMMVVLSCFLPKPSFAGLASTPWPMYKHDSRLSSLSEYEGPSYPVVLWSTGVFSRRGDIGIGSDGTLYFGDGNKLSAMDPVSRAIKWSFICKFRKSFFQIVEVFVYIEMFLFDIINYSYTWLKL